MTQRLDSTVALVTGASSGIGAATAQQLAARGATVALVARRADRLKELAASIEGSGGKAFAVDADITDRDEANGAVQRVVETGGRLDTVVNNAGVMFNAPAQEASLDDWERMVSINVMGVLHVSHAALPHLLSAAETSPRSVADLINVSSVAGRRASEGSGVYNLTKFGVGAFTESLRQEVTTRNLRVSVIEPGLVDTELFGHQSEEAQQRFRQKFGEVESLHPEDIAEAIEYTVTRPRRVAVNEILVRPTDQQN